MKDERKFKEVIHGIKGAEKDKDKFCKAARIERQPMCVDTTPPGQHVAGRKKKEPPPLAFKWANRVS